MDHLSRNDCCHDIRHRSRHTRLEICLRNNSATLSFLSAHIQNHLHRMLEAIRLIETATLPPREHECLRSAADGLSQTDIAQITSILLHTVARDIENISAKLGIWSTVQAVAIYAAYEVTIRRVH